MTEATHNFLLPVFMSFDSTKETVSTAAPKAQESSKSSTSVMTEKQREEEEWESINVLLMTHGLKPLSLVKRTDMKDLIIFDKQSSQRMRENLKTLMEETSRQQNMIRELIETNTQLKNELQLEQSRAADQEQRANDLEQIMESVKSKIGEMEDESLNRVCQQQNKIGELQKEHKALQAKCQHYKKKRMEQQETIASLQKDIYRLTKEEEERIVTQNRVFSYLCKRVPHTILDRQLLCLIDYYESKIRKLRRQRLQDIISQKKAEDKEEKDEPSRDKQHQALMDQRYFQDLYKSLKILSAELVPWHNLKKQDENEGIKVEDLLFMVDTMLEELENKEKDSNMPDFQILQAIVSHFQKLFDVPSLTGVYPRMNEVYTRLGEMNNAVRNLQELLELDSSSSLCVLVSTVGKLCRLINEDVTEKVMQVLGPEDLQSIINKLEEHEEFFPAFQAFTNDLLEILEIDDLDAIVPAVRKLKILSY
uniref:Centrosomal protein of 70 kDa n=1 Tax=Sus scrofa TaxID=9823 RepID=A0A8D1W9X6_PIG